MMPIHLDDALRHLRNAPDQYVRKDGSINWEKIYEDLGIYSNTDLGRILVTLVLTSPEVTATVHATLLQVAFGKDIDPRHLSAFADTPITETPWLYADVVCEACAGSTLHLCEWECLGLDKPSPQKALPRCHSVGRIDRWSNCLKYRESLATAPQVDAEPDVVYDGLEPFRRAYREETSVRATASIGSEPADQAVVGDAAVQAPERPLDDGHPEPGASDEPSPSDLPR